jgi:hypothetical protein
MKSFKGIAALAALALFLPLQSLAAGAIAVDDSNLTQVGYGWVIGRSSMEDAGSAAWAECVDGGNKHCRIATRFERCGAFAASAKSSNAGSGSTKAEAISSALRNCKDCKIVVADCDLDPSLRMTSAPR